jgi:hypothetical protein
MTTCLRHFSSAETGEVFMRYMQSPNLSDEESDSDFASDGADTFDERAGSAADDSIYDARLRWPRPGARQGASGAANNRLANKRPSFATRMLRATARFFVAVLIGIVGTLSWQAYGDQAQKMAVARYPSLAGLVSLLPAPSNAATASAPAASAQPDPVALDVVALRHEVEQLAANQGEISSYEAQIARTVAAIQATEQEINQKIAAIAEPKPVHLPPRKPASPQRLAPTSLAPEPQVAPEGQ